MKSLQSLFNQAISKLEEEVITQWQIKSIYDDFEVCGDILNDPQIMIKELPGGQTLTGYLKRYFVKQGQTDWVANWTIDLFKSNNLLKD